MNVPPPPPAGVVTDAEFDGPDTFPAASVARTTYVYAVLGLAVVSQNDVTVPPTVVNGEPFRVIE